MDFISLAIALNLHYGDCMEVVIGEPFYVSAYVCGLPEPDIDYSKFISR